MFTNEREVVPVPHWLSWVSIPDQVLWSPKAGPSAQGACMHTDVHTCPTAWGFLLSTPRTAHPHHLLEEEQTFKTKATVLLLTRKG